MGIAGPEWGLLAGNGARMSTKTRPGRAGKETGLLSLYGYHDRGEETEENVDGGSY